MTSSSMKTTTHAFVLVTLITACWSSDRADPEAPAESSGAAAGTGGSAGTGDAGSSSTGTGGSDASGGVAGSAAAGSAGNAGSQAASAPFGPVGSECTTEDDCRLVSDCCRCVAAPKGVTLDVCYASCAETMCIAGGVTGSERVCVNGRCVLDRSCDRMSVTCDMAPPECEPGTIPSVEDGCYGPCIASTECRD